MFRVYIAPPDESGESQHKISTNERYSAIQRSCLTGLQMMREDLRDARVPSGVGRSMVDGSNQLRGHIRPAGDSERVTIQPSSATAKHSESRLPVMCSGIRRRNRSGSALREISEVNAISRPDGKWLARTGKDPGKASTSRSPMTEYFPRKHLRPASVGVLQPVICSADRNVSLLPPIKEQHKLEVPTYLQRTLQRAQSLKASSLESTTSESQRSKGAETLRTYAPANRPPSTGRSSNSCALRSSSRRRIRLKAPTFAEYRPK